MATWDPSAKTSGITLSGGNLVASNATDHQGVRATVSKGTGKWYFEVAVTAVITANYAWAVGIGNSSTSYANGPGTGSGSNDVAMYNHDGKLYSGGTSIGTVLSGAPAAGDIIGVALHMSSATSGLIWFRDNNLSGAEWNNSGTATPVTDTGGISISFSAGPLFPEWGTQTAGGTNTATLNTGTSAFTMTIPSGYTAWDTGGGGFAAYRGMFALR